MDRLRAGALAAVWLAVSLPAKADQTAPPAASSTTATAQDFDSETPEQRVQMSLQVFVRAAVERNLVFLTSEATLGTARYNAKAARTAFDPIFNASYQQNRSDQRFVTDPSGSGPLYTNKSTLFSAGVSKNTTFGTSLSLAAQTQHIDQDPSNPFPVQNTYKPHIDADPAALQGGGTAAAYAAARIAELGGDAALATAQRTIEIVIAEVESAYWSLRLQEQNEDAARADILELAEEMLHHNQGLNQLRLISDHDVLTAEEGVENDRVTYLGAVHTRQDSADDLIFLVTERRSAKK